MIAVLFISFTACNSMESDAKKLAKLEYELEQNPFDEKKNKELQTFLEECMKKYEDKEDEFDEIYEEEKSKLLEDE